jgi:hypothetical protein
MTNSIQYMFNIIIYKLLNVKDFSVENIELFCLSLRWYTSKNLQNSFDVHSSIIECDLQIDQ